MLRRIQKPYTLYAPSVLGTDGESRGELLGVIFAAMHARSSLEVQSEDLRRCHETAYAIVPSSFTPEGGFVRGMLLQGDGARYEVLSPTPHGRFWSLKCIRVHG